MSGSGTDVWIIGGGGHAKVVIATLQAAGFAPRGIFDDDPRKHGSAVLGVPVLGAVPDPCHLAPNDRVAVLAIGANAGRKRIAEASPGMSWIGVVHPAAIVHSTVAMGAGTVVFAGAVIQPDTRIGAHVIVNTGARIDHDGRIDDYCHVAPGCVLAGDVVLEEGVFLGTGAAIIPGRRIGGWTVVGAGSVVIRDVPHGITVAGVPAQQVLRRETP